jgi:hypothetical protein
MMVHAKPALPSGHGELVAQPVPTQWAEMARANHERMRAWDFEVAGRPAAAVREVARREALASAGTFSARLGVPVQMPGGAEGLIVATGHQPELYHPGVWVKDFLLQRLADEMQASALDIVVDSDSFDTVAVSSPCLVPDVHRCTQYLAVGGENICFACEGVPSEREIEDWIAAVEKQLATLSAPAIRRHFAEYASALRSARTDACDLAELVTFARRRFEASAHTTYLELPATRMCASEGFSAFAVDLALAGERFTDAYNGALAEYRAINKTRSAAQPFPDLEVDGPRRELPLWLIAERTRHTLWCERTADALRLSDEGGAIAADLPLDPADAVATLRASGLRLAPKALALTTYVRGFVSDFFIHGIGGGGYDRVTDEVFRRYYGVEPPEFAVASLTMYLPLGMHVVSEQEVSQARERLNRLEHNPDAMLGEVDFDTPQERVQASSLAAEKTQLVNAISQPDADKKSLGSRIREVNAELAALLAPLRASLEVQLASLESQRAASEILTDRTYPLCFWSPQEVADKAR